MPRTLPDQLTISELILQAEHRLALGFHPERARRDAEMLLLHIVQQHTPERNRAWLIAHGNTVLLSHSQTRFSEFVARRVAGEPIQYIVGETEFFGLPFRVTPDVLIPRPETEHLVEKAIELARRRAAPRIVDVCTGSGAIAVALARALPAAGITATDLSDAALTIARENARHNAVDNRIRFLQGDLLAPLAGERFDLVVANPPYVPTIERGSMSVEVRDYEPALALFAGDDGLDIYRRLISAAPSALVPGGFIALEIGYGQARDVEALLAAAGFVQIEFIPDLQDIPRVAFAVWPAIDPA
jgi:release factor glutamine methyltransferase